MEAGCMGSRAAPLTRRRGCRKGREVVPRTLGVPRKALSHYKLCVCVTHRNEAGARSIRRHLLSGRQLEEGRAHLTLSAAAAAIVGVVRAGAVSALMTD